MKIVMIVSKQFASQVSGNADYDTENSNVRLIFHLAAFNEGVLV